MSDYHRLFNKDGGSDQVRIKLKYLLSKIIAAKYKPTNDALNNLAGMISVCQGYNDYRFLSDRDVQAATKSPEISAKIVSELGEQFFAQNRSMLSLTTAQSIIDLCINEPEYYPMIEYFRCLPQDSRESRAEKYEEINRKKDHSEYRPDRELGHKAWPERRHQPLSFGLGTLRTFKLELPPQTDA